MKFVTLLTILAVVSGNIQAQQWKVRFNGTGNGIDLIKKMVVDKAGNVYVTGSSYSGTNSNDYVTIKYNTNGVQQWLARYNGPGSGSDIPNAIFVDNAGNVYVTGYSDQLTGGYINNDVATVKYSPTGAQLWVKRYDGTLQRTDAGNDVKVDAAGNVYVTGSTVVHNGAYSKEDYLTIKYNSIGVQQWTATYNGPANKVDIVVGLGLDNVGNVYVTGTSFAGADPLGEEDFATIKYNANGIQQWVARYNGPASEPDRATAIAVDGAGNSYVTGYSQGNDLDFATIKYNTNGVQQWAARYDGPVHSSDISYAIALDNSGNVYVTGSDQTILYNTDLCTIKYNANGVQQWRAHYASASKDNDEAYALVVDATGNVFVTGYINGVSPSWNLIVVKYNSTGTQQWVKTYDGPGHGNDYGASVGVDGNGNVYVAGASLGAGSDMDYITVKYTSAGARLANEETEIAELAQKTNPAPSLQNEFKIFPNPLKNDLTLQLPAEKIYDISVIDVTGKQVFQTSGVRDQLLIDCHTISSGDYYVRISGSDGMITRKIIKE
ncbi:MAG: hypothetical protein JWN78_1399 [Bacteroidota bacterium]|nr:hypothetical protein [Bacteroidota bacterium]